MSNYISITKLLDSVTVPFDKEGMSERIANRDNITKKEVLDKWEMKANHSKNMGISLHTYVKNKLSGVSDSFNKIDEKYLPFIKQWESFMETKNWYQEDTVLFPEISFIDNRCMVRGQADVLAVRAEDSSECVDWKFTNEPLSHKSFNNFLEPIEHIPDTKINRYLMQVALYLCIIHKGYFHSEDYSRTGLHKGFIVNITPDEVTIYNLDREFIDAANELLHSRQQVEG